MYTGNYLVSLQLLWSQGIRVSHCLSFKMWLMCLMAPSSQSIIKKKKLPNIKIAEFPLSKLDCLEVNFSTSCSYSSLTDRSHHLAHKWEVLCNLLPCVHRWLPSCLLAGVCTQNPQAGAGSSHLQLRSPRTLEPCLDVLTLLAWTLPALCCSLNLSLALSWR